MRSYTVVLNIKGTNRTVSISAASPIAAVKAAQSMYGGTPVLEGERC